MKREPTTIKRPVVCIGWGAHSAPLYRFKDELHLPDHMRSIVPVEQRPRP